MSIAFIKRAVEKVQINWVHHATLQSHWLAQKALSA
jgi:hypothetical protein